MRRAKPSSNRYCAILLSALCGCAASSEEGGVDGLAQVEADPDETPPSTNTTDVMDAGSPVTTDAAPPAVDAGPPPPPPNVVKLKDATGAEVAEIVASGKGCPLGSWDATMDEDGLGYSATFDAMNLDLSAATAFTSLNCTLSFLPPNAENRQFSVQSITYAVMAKLDDLVTGAVELRHFYQGIRANTAPGHAYEQGPFEGPIALTREVATREARWTPCGTRPRGVTGGVNADVLIRLNNGIPRAAGSILGDATAGSKLSVRLMTRSCPLPVDAGPRTPTPATR